jgi:acid phosphatase (class A)
MKPARDGGFLYNLRMNFRRTQLLLVAALLLGACSSRTAEGILRKTGISTPPTYYVAAAPYKTIDFAPPPAPGSDAQKADIAAILDWQQKRTQAQCDHANLTADVDYDYFWGAKPLFPKPLPPEVKKFLDRLYSDLEGAVTNLKDRYRRPRPYKAYPDQAVPCIKKSWGYSYPSGHSSFSRVFANVLSDIAPERRDEFFARADEVAQDRVIGGVHFPTDIAAGKAFGDQFHAELLKSEAYRKDVEKMKAFLVK